MAIATAPAPYAAAPTVKERPFGVVLLAVLFALEGIVMLFGAIGRLFLGAVNGSAGDSLGIGGAFTAIFAAVGVVLLILGILAFLVAWGLYSGKGWARMVAIILAVLALIVGLVSIMSSLSGIVQLVIAILILYYLFQPRVKAYYV